ncbi:MAG: hypothetical protein B0D96_00200 [Candidatus Sedimenticola endophacoides]|uniref:Flagellar motor switch protein FliG n=1 Tax=Candidatus Sedimenticola endophacoides TaxID=2548426 RepID=A0A6N4DRQ2_9GAMM|nr:MAG: hypothetical protein B0D94_12315 [Candidatus Sedimenticola endophacoides]OQX38443.1 MAG: hypothetical protein B0D89_12700 [Candidatus Sedimenticola endophacoides]OQX38448.1 MAG: hypothetical protein B0D96_00200 [Candidatus Sedimenticola endophacoides]PUD99986.1 MAG: hypothetical protein C3L24_09890 [Candidatus Sedimenticola endophacoides]PUE00357.1 MAG: hypothetical protein C3L26_06060 [Candidatus Sedimenticola endophacoides]
MPDELSSGEQLSGVDRAAILLLALGEEDASSLLSHMGPKEVQELGVAMAGLTNVSTTQMAKVMGAFIESVKTQTNLGLDSDKYIRSVLTRALGSDKASGVIDRILLGRNSKGLEQLKWMDPRAIAEMIRTEHPQIVSIVLSFLDSDQAAGVLNEMSEEMRADIIR